jgi:hypothetical protein
MVEVQYLQTTITDAQRYEFGQLVEHTIGRIDRAEFLPHSGIRFPQNHAAAVRTWDCVWGSKPIVDSNLIRRPGADSLGWLDELNY